MSEQQELIPLMPGDILRHARLIKGLTLEQAAVQARIRFRILDAIETGQTSEIPSVYLRGHIRHYATFLGVKPQQLERHMEHVVYVEPDVQSVFEFKHKRRDSDKWLKATSYLVASALVATLAWQFTHEAVRFSQSSSHLNASMASINLPETGPAEPMEELLAVTDAGDSSSGSLALVNGAGGQTVTAVDEIQRLRIETSADTWVEILDAGGAHLEMDLLRAGESREYRGKAPLNVMLGRASAVVVWYNGEAVDLSSHTRGNVARISLGGELLARTEQPTESTSH